MKKIIFLILAIVSLKSNAQLLDFDLASNALSNLTDFISGTYFKTLETTNRAISIMDKAEKVFNQTICIQQDLDISLELAQSYNICGLKIGFQAQILKFNLCSSKINAVVSVLNSVSQLASGKDDKTSSALDEVEKFLDLMIGSTQEIEKYKEKIFVIASNTVKIYSTQDNIERSYSKIF